MKKASKIKSILLVATMLMGTTITAIASISAFAMDADENSMVIYTGSEAIYPDSEEQEEENIASGTAGDGVNWIIDGDGTLTISGAGEIEVGWYSPPWKDYNDSILKIVIEEGITTIPGTAFCYANNCTEASVSASVETIETYANAFSSMSSLERITIDENNPNYKSIDGIVFSKDEKTIVVYPQNKDLTEYTVPDSVKK